MTETPVREQARTVAVAADRDGQRLDNFLLGQLKGAPRSLIYRIVRSGEVRVNGGRAKPDTRLCAGDQVRLPPIRLTVAGTGAAPLTAAERLATQIVFEDASLLVLNKPAGVAAHGGSGIRFGAIELLRRARPEASLELVHRLDRETSGVLVLAKKRSALRELQRMLREGGIEKRYLALLVGRVPGSQFEVNLGLRKSALTSGERMVRIDDGGKPSISHFRVLERVGGHTWCEVRIETGRTHQIRVHAAHIGHPVAGDDKYGDRDANRRLRDQYGLKRMFLHAASLRFTLALHEYVLDAPLPPELRAVLDTLA